jgi:hypothetical protein
MAPSRSNDPSDVASQATARQRHKTLSHVDHILAEA